MAFAVGLDLAFAPHHKANVGVIEIEFANVFEVYVVRDHHTSIESY